LKKSDRLECLFCERCQYCGRLESNSMIVKAIEIKGQCPDRRPIWFNPSERIRFHEIDEAYFQVGENEPRMVRENGEINFSYRPLMKELKEYLDER